MEWNAGESPLTAQLNQSALPAAIRMNNLQGVSPLHDNEELLHEQWGEIEVLRKVHSVLLQKVLGPAGIAASGSGLIWNLGPKSTTGTL